MSGLLLLSHPVVPQAPPLVDAVGPVYEVFDGFELPDDPYAEGFQADGLVATPLGWSYGSDVAKPGGLPSRGPSQGGITGKVGAVGAQPLPVAECVHKDPSQFQAVKAPLLTTQFFFGPGGVAPGIAETLSLQNVQDNPPEPGSLESILLGAS